MRKFRLHKLHGFKNFAGVSMSAVDGEDIYLGLGQFLGALQEISGGSNRGTYAQAALRILRSIRILQLFLDVFDCDQALEVVLVIDHEKFFHAVLVKNFFRFFERGSDRDRDEIFLGHHLVDGNVEAGFKAQVAVGENSDKLAVVRNRHSGNLVFAHDLKRIANLVGGMHGDRVDDHAAFRALHLVHFVGLLIDGEVAMDDANPALLGERDRHVRLGDCVHGGAHDGNVQTNLARKLRLRAGSRRDNVRAGGQEKDVVKSESLRNGKMNHKCLGNPRERG